MTKSETSRILLGSAVAVALAGYYSYRKLKAGFKLDDKVVLVTGGSRGLGYILAQKIALQGAKVIICAHNPDQLDKAYVLLRNQGVITHPYLCDITSKEDVAQMAYFIKKRFGRLDVLLNNAGTINVGPMENMTTEDFKNAMKVHLWGPFQLVKTLLPLLKDRTGSRIVNIISIAGKVSIPHLMPYNVSKFALAGFSEGITTELAGSNIKVTTVYPGLMRTGSPMNAIIKGQHQKEYTWFKIADSLPLISMNAEKAADKIINAFRKGKKTLTLTFPARLAGFLKGIDPSLNMNLLQLIENLLPAETQISPEQSGSQSESRISKSFLGKPSDKAANQHNE